MNMKINIVLLACAAIGIGVAGSSLIGRKPTLYEASEASCKQEAIRNIPDIAARAILDAKCAERHK